DFAVVVTTCDHPSPADSIPTIPSRLPWRSSLRHSEQNVNQILIEPTPNPRFKANLAEDGPIKTKTAVRISRSDRGFLRHERQRQTELILVFALLVRVARVALGFRAEEEDLCDSFAGVDPCGQRRGVADFDRDLAAPLRLERRHVDDNPDA